MGRIRRQWAWLVSVAIGLVAIGGWIATRPHRRVADPLTRAREAYAQGQWREASHRAAEQLGRNPHDGTALKLLARALARLGRAEEARGVYQRLGGPNAMEAEDFYVLAVAFDHDKQPQLVWGALEQALRLQPDYPEALAEMARLLAAEDRLEEAVPLAQRLTKVKGWNAKGNVVLGILLKQMNDSAGTAGALGKALASDSELKGCISSPTEVRKLLGRALLEVGKASESRSYLEPLVSARNSDREANWLLSRAFLQQGDQRRAAAALEGAAGFGDEHPEAPEPAPYVGSAACTKCHAEQYRTQQSSLHARTFRYASQLEDLPLPAPKTPDPNNTKVHHTIQRQDNSIRMETQIDDKTYRALVDYAMGSGDRGLTLVGRDDQGMPRELRLSRYNDGSGWDRTTGHLLDPTDPGDYLGKPLARNGVRRCLICHTTNFRAVQEQSGPEFRDHAIGCERCHGPGGNHLKAVDVDFTDLAIGQPHLASASQLVKLCGQCHSPRGSEVKPENPASVRFQATTLTWSKCYSQSEGQLSCVTCHNPHRNASSSTSFYESKCLSCHAGSRSSKPESARSRDQRACTVSPTRGCINCHMPTVSGVVPHSPFTDHFIRIHADASGRAAD